MQKSHAVVWQLGTASLLAMASVGRAQDAGTLRGEQAPPDSFWVDRLDLSLITQDYGKPGVGKSVDGNPIRLGGMTYPHGIGTHARSDMAIDLYGAAVRVSAVVGIDDERAGKGSVTFTLIVDGKKTDQSPVLHGGDPPRMLTADLTYARRLILRVGDGGDGITNDHADWAGALLTLEAGATERPEAIAPPTIPVAPPRIVMLPPDPAPAIHGPRIFGATPGRPFLFRIPATGQGPLTFGVRHIPDGLTLDRTTGILDIVYSLCQYGMGDMWKWCAEVGGNCWRTTGDIDDNWGNVANILVSQAGHEAFAGPGHWNDPDMLVVGIIGWGNPHPTRLTPNEQVLHMSMWCLLSSPLLIGCDMTRLDPLTLALLTNDEAIEIDQDPLGKSGRRVSDNQEGAQVWARPLWDGTTAVCLINLGHDPQNVTADWKALGLKGSQPVRDLWLHKDLGRLSDTYTVSVPAHGAVLLKIGKPHR